MYSLTLLDDNLINRFDEDPSFSLQNSSPLTSSKRKQQYDGGLSDFLHPILPMFLLYTMVSNMIYVQLQI